MAAAQAFFKERFRIEYNTHAWHQWQSICKNDRGKESYMQWAARCKESYDRVSHMNPGQALPFQLLRDKVLGPCSDYITLQCLSAGTFGELQAQLQKADQLQAIRSLQNKKIQNETEELKQELADMKAMVQRLQSTQTGSGVSMPVNTITTPQQPPPHIKRRLAPNTQLKSNLFGNQQQQARIRKPRTARHDNDICYECNEVGTGHYSWNCPQASSDTKHLDKRQRVVGPKWRRCDTCGKFHLGRCRLLTSQPNEGQYTQRQQYVSQRRYAQQEAPQYTQQQQQRNIQYIPQVPQQKYVVQQAQQPQQMQYLQQQPPQTTPVMVHYVPMPTQVSSGTSEANEPEVAHSGNVIHPQRKRKVPTNNSNM
jgi:hypothetical protein